MAVIEEHGRQRIPQREASNLLLLLAEQLFRQRNTDGEMRQQELIAEEAFRRKRQGAVVALFIVRTQAYVFGQLINEALDPGLGDEHGGLEVHSRACPDSLQEEDVALDRLVLAERRPLHDNDPIREVGDERRQLSDDRVAAAS